MRGACIAARQRGCKRRADGDCCAQCACGVAEHPSRARRSCLNRHAMRRRKDYRQNRPATSRIHEPLSTSTRPLIVAPRFDHVARVPPHVALAGFPFWLVIRPIRASRGPRRRCFCFWPGWSFSLPAQERLTCCSGAGRKAERCSRLSRLVSSASWWRPRDECRQGNLGGAAGSSATRCARVVRRVHPPGARRAVGVGR